MGLLSTTRKHIRTTPYQSFAASITMFLAFLITGAFMMVIGAIHATLTYFESKPQIIVFFTDEATTADIQTLTDTLQKTGKVAKTQFISKDEALVQYKDQNKNDPLLLEMVTADILPSSLEVSAVSPALLPDLQTIIKGTKGVEEIVYQQDVVDSLLRWTNGIRTGGLIVVILLFLSATLTTMTVIGMKISTRKDEIDILKLLGATQWYIRGPFLIEGMWHGGVGALSAWGMLTIALVSYRNYILQFLGSIPVISALLSDPTSPLFLTSAFGFLGILLLSGLMLGVLSSIVAINRFLKL